MTGKKISTQERDRLIRRYMDYVVRHYIEVRADILNELQLATDDYDSGNYEAWCERANDAIQRALNYNNECETLERALAELAADGDTRSIVMFNNGENLRKQRAEWIDNIRRYDAIGEEP